MPVCSTSHYSYSMRIPLFTWRLERGLRPDDGVHRHDRVLRWVRQRVLQVCKHRSRPLQAPARGSPPRHSGKFKAGSTCAPCRPQGAELTRQQLVVVQEPAVQDQLDAGDGGGRLQLILACDRVCMLYTFSACTTSRGSPPAFGRAVQLQPRQPHSRTCRELRPGIQ